MSDLTRAFITLGYQLIDDEDNPEDEEEGEHWSAWCKYARSKDADR